MGVLASFAYDDLGRRTQMIRGNGAVTTWSYDGMGRLLTLGQDVAGSSYDVTFTLPRNPAGQITGRNATTAQYDYDPTPRVANAAYDGLNRDAAIAAVSGGYDARGNLTFDGTRTFVYDLENRLTSVSGGPAAVTLTYDTLGRLRTTVSGGATTAFLYDGDRLAAEYAWTGPMLRRYVHGPGVDEPLVWYEGSGTTDRRWLHSDHLGTVIMDTDDTGARLSRYTYGAWGEPGLGGWSGSRFRFTGQIMLPEAELYHYKARVYDPMFGRFMQTDPIGYGDGLNLYRYVANDPINLIDPTGLEFVCENGVCTENDPIEVMGQRPNIIQRLWAAVFDDVFSNDPPMSGPIDYSVIDARMCETRDSVQQNLEAASASGHPEAMAGAWPAAFGAWVAKVAWGGAWDDKKGVPENERQGNFSYGATAAELGLPKNVALRGAGAAQRASNAARAMSGKPLTPRVGNLKAPYGDDPRDQGVVLDGYDYGSANPCG